MGEHLTVPTNKIHTALDLGNRKHRTKKGNHSKVNACGFQGTRRRFVNFQECFGM